MTGRGFQVKDQEGKLRWDAIVAVKEDVTGAWHVIVVQKCYDCGHQDVYRVASGSALEVLPDLVRAVQAMERAVQIIQMDVDAGFRCEDEERTIGGLRIGRRVDVQEGGGRCGL